MSIAVDLSALAERVEEYGPIAYLVTVSGQGLPQKRNLTVFPLRLGWSQTSGNAPWNAIARPVTLLFAPGEASSIVASRMYPTEEDAAFRQTVDPHALLRALEAHIEAMLTFFEVNAKRSPLMVS